MASKPKLKWDFAIGTTSRVPSRPGYHYLMMDIDGTLGEIPAYLRKLGAELVILQPTPSGGWHIYTDLVYSWKKLFKAMPLRTDKKWLNIGGRRGYLFLADKGRVNFPWQVERMVLHYNGKKKIDA